jgi:hypothetical protein
MFFSCKQILFRFASFDSYLIPKEEVQEYYNKNFTATHELQYASKDMIKNVWESGGFPHVLILNKEMEALEIDNCFASFDLHMEQLSDSTVSMESIEKRTLTSYEQEGVKSILKKKNTNHSTEYFVLYYYIQSLMEQSQDSTINDVFYTTYNEGKKRLAEKDQNNRVLLLPINADFIKEEWTEKEVKKIFQKMMKNE